MTSNDLPILDFPLIASGPLSTAVRALGLESFADVAEFIRLLPYGRFTDDRDPAAILRARTGTCSSKHRFLAAMQARRGTWSKTPAPVFMEFVGSVKEGVGGISAVKEKAAITNSSLTVYCSD